MSNLIDYYRARSEEHDAVYARAERQGDIGIVMARLRDRLTGGDVLEVAAGTGFWTETYAHAARSVLVTDINPETLTVAERRLDWPDHVSFAIADAFNLGRHNVDACFVGFFWSGILRRDIPRFLSGLAISAAGARLVIVDNRYVAGSHPAISRTDEDGNAYQQRQHRDSPTWEALANYPTAAQVRADLHGIADDVEVEELTYYWIATATLRGG